MIQLVHADSALNFQNSTFVFQKSSLMLIAELDFVRGDNLTKCQTLSCPFLKKDMTKFEVLKKLILQRTRCRINFFLKKLILQRTRFSDLRRGVGTCELRSLSPGTVVAFFLTGRGWAGLSGAGHSGAKHGETKDFKFRGPGLWSHEF
jgi:hypothetical protein